MNDTAPLPPPPADARPFEPETTSGRFSRPVALFAAAAAIASAVAIALGTAIGFMVAAASESSCTPGDGWCGLGAALLGVFVGLLVAAIAYTVVGVIVIRRHRPAGERATPIAVHLMFPPVLVLGLQLLAVVVETFA